MHHVGLLGQNLGCLIQNVKRVFLFQPSLPKEVFLQESMIGLPLSMIVLKKEFCIRGFIHRRRRDLQAAEAKLEKRTRLVSASITIYSRWATYTLDWSIIEVWDFLRKALVLRRLRTASLEGFVGSYHHKRELKKVTWKLSGTLISPSPLSTIFLDRRESTCMSEGDISKVSESCESPGCRSSASDLTETSDDVLRC